MNEQFITQKQIDRTFADRTFAERQNWATAAGSALAHVTTAL
jgi:hypothetical protein